MEPTREYLFADLEAAARESGHISRIRSLDTWEAVPYETQLCSGVMLVAAQDSHPEPVTIPLGLHGWFKIYLGLIKLDGNEYTYFKLDSDPAFSGISTRTDGLDGTLWAKYENANEIFWKNAFLAGDCLHIMHPQTFMRELSAVMWIRCVEMTPQEIETHLRLQKEKGQYKFHAHIDTDFTSHDNLTSADDALTIYQWLRDSDVTMCTQELAFGHLEFCEDAYTDRYVGLHTAEPVRNRAVVEFEARRPAAYSRIIDYCRQIGVRLHACARMQLGSFQFPITYPTSRLKFAEAHPEYFIRTREGRTVNILSYAYPEVRTYMTGILTELYRQGFDGITLEWIRGNSFGFEQPVLDRIAEKYDGLDGRCLPMTDDRLHSVWCEFMNEFLRELRIALDAEAAATGRAKCNVHAIAMFTPELSKQMGLDIETWAEEGWLDGVTAGMYACYEDLEDCMAEDSGLIDLEKYCRKIRQTYILKRIYWMDEALMCEGIRQYEQIGQKYGIETYYSLNWEHRSPEVYAKEAELFYSCGARGIHTWDTNGRVKYPPEWHVTSRLAHRENCETALADYEALTRNYRVLKLGDNDISYICPNWRG